MYGNSENYYFYMQFRANDADAWWTSATNKSFVLLFQDGKSDTKWRGVKYPVTSTISSASTVSMTPIVVVESTKNTQYTSCVTADATADDASTKLAARLTALNTMLTNSSTETATNTDNFYGEIRYLSIAGAIRIAQVYVGRFVPEAQ